MHNFIIFSNSERLRDYVNELYNNKTHLHNLNNDLLISLDFPACGSKVHFAYDGIGLYDNQKEDLYKKLSKLNNEGRVFVCFHKTGNTVIQSTAVEKLAQTELFTVTFSHNEGLYKDLNSWYKGEISVSKLLQNHFLIGIQHSRNRIIENLLIGQVSKDSDVNLAQMNKEQKALYNVLSKRISSITKEDLEMFKNSLKFLDI